MADLGEKMIARADLDGLPAEHELRAKGAAFSTAAAGFYADPQTVDVKQFMGCWARARRCWSEYSGEPLL
jgi:hypothetical protein